MPVLTLPEAAERLALSPLQVVVQCALHGIPCQEGTVEEEVLPVLGMVKTRRAKANAAAASSEVPAEDESDQEKRSRVVRRILEKLNKMGRYWPARTEKRSTARGFDGSDVGLALRAADVLRDCGFLIEEARGAHEARVGLDGDRRHEIADLIAGRPPSNEELRDWIERG